MQTKPTATARTKKTSVSKHGQFPTASAYLPSHPSISSMKTAVQKCRGCDLYRNATQAVFGEGSTKATCVFIGEQPGNEEDLEGHPFVGPAGRLLDRALADAGIPREKLYLTNAVKHFKHEQIGRRRKHKPPNTAEVKACRPWLEQELRVTKPEIIVCMGVTAAKSVFGKNVTLKEYRGRFVETSFSAKALVTMHPSAILRSPDDDSRHNNYDALVADLKMVKKAMQL